MQTTATISFEIELALIGSVTQYCPATYDYPADGSEVEECEIEDISILSLVPAPEHEKPSHPRGVWKATSILDGVTISAPEIQKMFANIIALHQEECDRALADAADDYDGGDYE